MKQIKELLTQLKKADEKEQIQLLLEFSDKQKQQLENEIKTNETLKSSLAHYKQLFNLLQNGGEVIDAKGKIIDCSINTTKMIGYEIDEIVGKHITKFVDEDTAKLFKQNFPKLLSGESLSLEGCFVHKNGRKINVIQSAQPIRNAENKVTDVLVVSTDITERKQSEELLIKSENKYRDLYDNAPDMYFSVGLDGKVISVNKYGADCLGYKIEELVGKSVWKIVHKDDLKYVQEQIEAIVEKNTGTSELDFRKITKDKSIIYVHERIQIISNEDGEKVEIRIICRDITERKKAELELRKLNTAVKQSASIILITDYDGNIEFVNNAFVETTGYKAKEAIGKTPRILNSGKQTTEYYEEMWKTIKAGKDWKGEFCNKTKSGDLYWELATITPIMDANNKITNFIGVKENITERKQEEENQKAKVKQLQMMNDIMIDRELTLNDTRKEVNELLEKLGEEPKYVVISTD